jgi:hypothetical protein
LSASDFKYLKIKKTEAFCLFFIHDFKDSEWQGATTQTFFGKDVACYVRVRGMGGVVGA